MEPEEHAMSTALHLTTAEYEQMVERGAFDALQDRHIELFRGELREMSPQGVPHHHLIVFLTAWSIENLDRKSVAVSVQCPIQIPNLNSEPEPDIVWAKPVTKLGRHPRPSDIFLLMEVSRATLEFDLGDKALLYAEADIGEYWVIDVQGEVVHVFRQPTPTGYAQHEQFKPGDEVHPMQFPAVTLNVSELFAS